MRDPSSDDEGDRKLQVLLVAFGVDFGNLRRRDVAEPPMDDLCRSWNMKLNGLNAGTHVVHWRHKTGNFVVKSEDLNLAAVTSALGEVSGGKLFAVFAYDEFITWLSDVKAAAQSPPPVEPGRAWTPGMVMDTDPCGLVPPQPTGAGPISFGYLTQPRLRLAWRNDILRPGRTTLDPRRREGGWGRVAAEMRRQAGGTWTARALSRPTGMIDDFKRNGPRLQIHST